MFASGRTTIGLILLGLLGYVSGRIVTMASAFLFGERRNDRDEPLRLRCHEGVSARNHGPRRDGESRSSSVQSRTDGSGDRSQRSLPVRERPARAHPSVPQTAFDRRTRMANLKNAFALARGPALNPALHYILVDDVFTTGSTLNSCARALRRAGAVSLDVVTFGHG